jgi:hypothetical protein
MRMSGRRMDIVSPFFPAFGSHTRPGRFRTGTPAMFSLIIVAALLAAVTPLREARASDVRVSASVSSTHIAVGEQLTLNVEVLSREPRNVSRPELPELDGLQYLSSLPQTSSRYSLVDGVAQMSYRFNYTILAAREGSFQIPSVYVTVDGREYHTRPITVRIRPAGEEGHRPRARQPQRPDMFLELELSEERPVRGQQIVAEIVLYFRNTIDVNNFHVTQSWQTEGFWREDLNRSPTRRPESIVLDGVPYRRAVLNRYALFPTRTGELSIPSFSIRASVRQSGRFRDEHSGFFDGFGQQRNVDLTSRPRTVRVAAPPAPPTDGQLISALGQFRVERTLSQDVVKLGESVDVITEVRGSGNLGLITRPVFEYPGSFDTHRPRETIDRNERSPQMSGTKQFRDVLIARSAGTFTIPENTILVYDDIRRQYERHILPALTIEVVRDPNARISIAQDHNIRLTPIRGSVSWSSSTRRMPWLTWWFWFALILPAGAFAYGYRAYSYQSRLHSDMTFSRRERSLAKATEMLKTTSDIKGTKDIYSVIHNTVTSYIADRIDLPSAGLSIDDLAGELKARNVRRPLVRRVRTLLEKCATIRYTPDPSAQDMMSDLTEARKLLSELEAEI